MSERKEFGAYLGDLVGYVLVGLCVMGILWFMWSPALNASEDTTYESGGQREPVETEPESIAADVPSPRSWTCSYVPTMNDDWHDDILCSDGISADRPYLLPDDSYVTESEIMDAAAAHEAYLNGE